MVARVLALALCPAVALAANVSVRLQTDRIEVDQTIRAVVNVVGHETSAVPRMPPAPPGLAIEYLGTSTGIVQGPGRMMRQASFTWAVTGLEEGTHTFGPVDVYVDGTVYSTEPVQLVVVPRTAHDDDPVISVFAEFPVDEVWEGEVVLYRYGYRSRIPIYGDRWILPPFDRLQPPRDGLDATTEYTIQDPTGPIHVKETFKPLLATAPGDLGLLAASAILRIPEDRDQRRRPFGLTRTRDITVTTEIAPLTVKPLPPAPATFSGLVGDFDVSGRLDQDRVRVGESATYTVTIRGDGSLEGFELPEPPALPGARFYDSVVGADARVLPTGYLAEGRWQRVVVPTAPGRLDVPPLSIVTFSPTLEDYVTHDLTIGSLEVVGTDEGNAEVESFSPDGTTEGPTAAPDDDIRPIRTSGPLHTPWLGPWLPAMFGVAAAPGLIVLAATAASALRRRLTPPEAPHDPLDDVHATPIGTPERLAALESALRHALRAATGHDGVEDISALPPTLAQEVREVHAALGRARYADGAVGEDLDARLLAAIRALRDAAPETDG